MVQLVRVLTTQPVDSCLVFETHMEGESGLLQVVFRVPHICTHISGVAYLFKKWLVYSHSARLLSKHTKTYSSSFIVLHNYWRL